jgi:hypothetical protein
LIGRYLSNRSKAAPALLPPAQHTISRRWRTFVLAILVLAGALARPGHVSAQGIWYPGSPSAPGWWYWVPLEIGCARSIAVGANGVPWVLGCEDGPNGTGPARVYYLSWSNGSLVPYQWNWDYASVMTLSVNIEGLPFVTDGNGDVWAETANNGAGDTGYLMEPSGVWGQNSNAGFGAIAAGVTIALFPSNTGEMFYPAQYEDPNLFQPGDLVAGGTVWGIYCAMPCENGPITGVDSSIWYTQYQNYADAPTQIGTPWTQAPGVSAVAITMFTTPGGVWPNASDVFQTPWVLTTSGDLYAWRGPQWVHVPFPEKAVSISDGAVLGQSGILYFCYTTPCYSGSPQPLDWEFQQIYPTTYFGAPIQIKQIATGGVLSQSVIGGPADQTINSLPPGGPIAWAIDYNGNIYYTAFFTFAGGGSQ